MCHVTIRLNNMEFDDPSWGQFTDIENKPPLEVFTVLPYHHVDSDDEEQGGKGEGILRHWSLYVFAGGTLASIVGALTFRFT
jgi:hypothetical protein